MISLCLISGSPSISARPRWVTWNLSKGLLHRTGLNFAALSTSTAWFGTRGKGGIWEQHLWDSRLGHIFEFEMSFDMVMQLGVSYFLCGCKYSLQCFLRDCPSHGQSGVQIMAKVPEWVYKSPTFDFINWKSELILFHNHKFLIS